MRRIIITLLLCVSVIYAEPVKVRIVAANLTSGNYQTYSPDNGNHSNPEGAGARILKGLKPDIVLIQEFTTTVPVRQWVNQTLEKDFSIVQEKGQGIPNGILSRFSIIDSGEWDDPELENRDFIWAKIGLPNGTKLWVVSVHLYAKKPLTRTTELRTLAGLLKKHVQKGDRVVIGGDFNTHDLEEECLRELTSIAIIPSDLPADGLGNVNTNASRERLYDWVLVDNVTQCQSIPVLIGAACFPHGLVFDSRIFDPLSDVSPIQKNDSSVPQMQHMAIVRDFMIGE